MQPFETDLLNYIKIDENLIKCYVVACFIVKICQFEIFLDFKKISCYTLTIKR
jgi:hypothetical protein